MKNKPADRVLKLLMILFGNALFAFSVAMFIERSGNITGGTAGIGKVMTHWFGIPVSATFAIVNIVTFLLGLFILGKEFALTTLLSTIVASPFLRVFEVLLKDRILTSDPLLCAIFAGLLNGLSVGLVIRQNASTGGLDIPPLVLKKLFNIPVGVSMRFVSLCVVFLQMPFSNAEQVLRGMLQILITSIVIDQVITSGTHQISIRVISKKSHEIGDALLAADVGVTYFPIETGYLHEAGSSLLCAVSPRRLPQIKEIILRLDPNSFILVDSSTEIFGKGFSLPR